MFAGVPFGIAPFPISVALMNYMVDVSYEYAANAMAAGPMFRRGIVFCSF